ncbi:DNA-packaging protein [Thermoactinomyces sp. DSM 45892]|uniref:DNA-packaging protein n=1 Tax=Thermoactinomyces sp. DSM 45892 TaxID=1882753 RepID=UPI00089BF3F3|nr:terminase family protein [Thermoactinomyces sp. DSM 45892]SDY71556.1 Large terminase phage packaging protein [Thermoactinomyces sp. DSM 45892]
MDKSLAILVSQLPINEREELLDGLSDKEIDKLLYSWDFWARPNQLPPEGNWRTWLLLAGRGFGKTRTGAEYVIDQVRSGKVKRLALVAPTPADARDVMIQGESGILTISPPWFMPTYYPSKRRVEWPNGAIATIFSGAHPEQLRGPQHELAWCDELAAWKYPQETWDMLMFGLRLGVNPRAIITTTPKPTPLIQTIVKSSTTSITRGSTFENADNLAPAFLEQIVYQYEGTRLGRQELFAEILDDVVGALWKRQQLDDLRVKCHPELIRVVVGIDPAVTSEEGSDETGIVIVGKGVDGHAYVLDDLSLQGTPDGWARSAVTAYYKYQADRIVAEANNGGDLVEHTIRTVDPMVAYKKVHASRGKYIRAEPVAALYEQGRVHHVGSLGTLEDQMCTWSPHHMKSPDRMDALVWALTELMIGKGKAKVKARVV